MSDRYQTTDELAALLARRLKLLAQIRDLGARQAELIEQNDPDLLLKVLAGKQQLLDELLAGDRRLEPFRKQDPAERLWRDEALRAESARMAEASERLLRQIVEQEKQSQERMHLRRDDASQQLAGLHTAVQAHGAYRAAHAGPAAQLDLSTGDQP